MRQITPQEFLSCVEAKTVTWIGTVGRRVYGADHRGTSSDGIIPTVWADVP